MAPVTIGEGATAQVQADIQKLGTNLLQVFRGQGFGGGGSRSAAPPFTMDDVRAIEEEVSGVRAVAPASNTSAQAIYGNSNWQTQVTGTSGSFQFDQLALELVVAAVDLGRHGLAGADRLQPLLLQLLQLLEGGGHLLELG